MIRDISEFEPYIEFIRGRDNFIADALSRLGWNTQLPQDDSTLNELDIDQEEFRAKQEEDPILKPYLSVHRNDVGLAILEGQGQVLAPALFVPTVLSLAHDAAAHQGSKKMLARLEEPHYWWPSMKAEIANDVVPRLHKDVEMYQYISDHEK